MLRTEMLGYLGRDPETRYMPSGQAVTNFTMAHTDKWRDKDSGEQKERTEWVRWVAFGKQAELIQEHCRKGSLLWCAGQQQTREWEKDGHKHYTTEIKLREFQFAGGRDQEPTRNDNADPGAAPPPADDFDDDIPF